VDPLFVIDLSAPASPTLLGELKIPGYSDYLHPLNSTHLIGIGKDASLAGVVRGVKLALFDASTPAAPIEAYTLLAGDRGSHSAALDDHKAFLYHTERRLLTLPLRLRQAGVCTDSGWGSSYPEATWQGVAVWRVGEAAFELEGLVSHYTPSATPYVQSAYQKDGGGVSPSGYDASGVNTYVDGVEVGSGGASGLPLCTQASQMPRCEADASTAIARALYIGDDTLYTVSALKVRADSLDAMRNLTRDAISATSNAAAAWEGALSGSGRAEVALPHDMCASYSYSPVAYDSVSGAVAPRSAAAAPPPPPCACFCATTCTALPQEMLVAAAQAARGLG